MPRRSSKKLKAELPPIVEQPAETEAEPSLEVGTDGKNPAAVALGRLGGKKGGIARAAKLSAQARSEIAKKAALARWAKGNG
jgi:hypothetical protein